MIILTVSKPKFDTEGYYLKEATEKFVRHRRYVSPTSRLKLPIPPSKNIV